MVRRAWHRKVGEIKQKAGMKAADFWQKEAAKDGFKLYESLVLEAFAAPSKTQKKRLDSDGFRPLFRLGSER